MNDATNGPQTALVVGGTSDLAQAVVARLAATGLRAVVLAGRDRVRLDDASVKLRAEWPALAVEVTAFEADDEATHAAALDAAVATLGDVDLVLVAVGALGTPDAGTGPPAGHAEALAVARATFVGPMSIAHLAAQRLHAQGHGTLVVLSSAAALRPRRTNPAYGAAKAALDGYTRALADRLHGSGVDVVLVRPAFVTTRMTAGLSRRPPLATTPAVVADAVVAAVRERRPVVWVPRAAAWPARLVAVAPAWLVRRAPW